MSDNILEFTSTAPRRFALWEDVLQDVGFARGYGPAHGQPGYEEHERQAAQAVDLLPPHLDLLAKTVDPLDPHVRAHLESIERSLESARQPVRTRRLGSLSLDLSHLVESIEALLLDLIGPEGQSPVARGQIELPTQPYFEAWLAAATGCANLVPSVDATQTIGWRMPRAFLHPGQAAALVGRDLRDVPFETCCGVLREWNARSETKVWVGSTDAAERKRYDAWQAVFVEGFVQLSKGLSDIAERGEVYLGWITWTGYE